MTCPTCGASPKPLIRHQDTPEQRAFWESVEDTAAFSRSRPDWERTFYKRDEVCPTCGTAHISGPAHGGSL